MLVDSERLHEALSPRNGGAVVKARTFRARSSSRSSSRDAKGFQELSPANAARRLSVSLKQASAGNVTGGKPCVPQLVKNLVQYQQCESVLNDLVGLCDRNSSVVNDKDEDTSKKNESNNEKLWFTVLDFVLEQKHIFSVKYQNDAGDSLQTVLADFVHVVLTHMNGKVSLHSILKKITNDHKNQEFREFRSTITGMLENVRYEQKILSTAKQLLADAKVSFNFDFSQYNLPIANPCATVRCALSCEINPFLFSSFYFFFLLLFLPLTFSFLASVPPSF